MEVYHCNGPSTGYLKISVSAPNPESKPTWQTYEVNQISTSYTNVPEERTFTLNGATGGTFNFSIFRRDLNTLKITYDKKVQVDYNATEAEFKTALRQFDIYKYSLTVTKNTTDDGWIWIV